MAASTTQPCSADGWTTTSGPSCQRRPQHRTDDRFSFAPREFLARTDVPRTEGRVTDSSTQPPSDAESWTDEQWLTWLKDTDEAVEVPDAPVPASFRVTHSAVGQTLGDAMRGLAN